MRYLLMILITSGLLLKPSQGVRAQAMPALHTIQIYVRTDVFVSMMIDGKLALNSVLKAGVGQQWQGRQFELKVDNAAAVEVTLDGQLSGALGAPNAVATLRWPPVARGKVVVQPTYYVVQPGDTLFTIAQRFNTDLEVLLQTNQLGNPDLIQAGALLAIPGSDGSLPTRESVTAAGAVIQSVIALPNRGTILERMTGAAQTTAPASPFHQTTWVTYYGRPDVPIMGILGEHDLDKLTTLLKQQAGLYDQANGDDLGVMPAFHLVYGMATKAPGEDNSYLTFLSDEVVQAYIDRAAQEKFAVILDIQIGALTPADAIKPGLPWLKYKHVHLAIDPEFAMSHRGQALPGDPIGFITAQQVNEVQATMQAYLQAQKLTAPRILLLHQFLEEMIVEKEKLDGSYANVELTIVADGWGGPWGKISKYNDFMDANSTEFSAFKLFYRWDEPILTEREALGVDAYGGSAYMEVTPNLIIYQ